MQGIAARNIGKMLPTGPLDDSAIDHAKAFMATKKNRSQTRCLVDIAIDAMEVTDDDIATGHAKAFIATPKKNNPKDTMDCVDNSNTGNSEIDGSTISASDAGQETEASDESHGLNGSKVISELSSIEDSENDLKPSRSICLNQTRRMQSQSQESHRLSQKKKGRFIVPKEHKKVRDEARERSDNALNQVPDAVHFDQKGQRTTKTLYVGNLNITQLPNLHIKRFCRHLRLIFVKEPGLRRLISQRSMANQEDTGLSLYHGQKQPM
jgi:hypothetical protein